MMASTLFQTIRHLKPVQIYRRIYRPSPRVRKPGVTVRRATGRWAPAIPRVDPRQGLDAGTRSGLGRFLFLNQVRQIETWNDAGIPKLWLYNLHYFEHAEVELMRKWVGENPAGHGNGWEPYPLSLRIVNWIKSGLPLDVGSLATQAQYLFDSVEYHLLGNHLFANAKALVFAGTYFDCERWLRRGLRILEEQIPEQILSDGGHFERSPMYHSIILEDLLDLINLSHAYPGVLPDWPELAGKMLCWLRHMTHPDGRISFFNDAAFGVAPEPQELEAYAARLGVNAATEPLGESGYIRLEANETCVLFDAAPIGPDYQPGHAHADTLSFEMSHAGKRVVVNSGTSTYERSPERLLERGTAAHSTAVVDGRNQSDVWAAFRVGRRARPLEVSTDHRVYAEAAHDGCRPLIHRRRLELEAGRLTVHDCFAGPRGIHDIDVYFHLYPKAEPRVELDSKFVCRREPGSWQSGFNLPVPNERIEGHYHGPVPVTFRSIITNP
jgi:hypothetical protein